MPLSREDFVKAYKQLRSNYTTDIKAGKATLKMWKIARLKFINENKPKDFAGRAFITDKKKKHYEHLNEIEKSKQEELKKKKQHHITSSLVADYNCLTLEEFESRFKQIKEAEK